MRATSWLLWLSDLTKFSFGQGYALHPAGEAYKRWYPV